MPVELVTTDEFATLLAPMLEQPVDHVDVVKHVARLYSNMWILRVQTANGSQCVVAKSWYKAAHFKKQIDLLRRVRVAYAGRNDVCIPYLGSCDRKCLLLMQQVFDPTLAELCQYSLQYMPSLRSLREWQNTLRQACRRAGSWLSEWHAATESNSSVAPSLETYLEDREDHLELLDGDDRRRLYTLIQSLEVDTTCIAHGDFMPGNVLWAPDRLSVIDFGVPEWERTTPWWDYVSMEVGLICVLGFGLKSPGRWIPSIVRMATQAFRDGYGQGRGSIRGKFACQAVRHLVLYGTDSRHGRAYRKRARWHMLQLQKALADAEKIN